MAACYSGLSVSASSSCSCKEIISSSKRCCLNSSQRGVTHANAFYLLAHDLPFDGTCNEEHLVGVSVFLALVLLVYPALVTHRSQPGLELFVVRLQVMVLGLEELELSLTHFKVFLATVLLH